MPFFQRLSFKESFMSVVHRLLSRKAEAGNQQNGGAATDAKPSDPVNKVQASTSTEEKGAPSFLGGSDLDKQLDAVEALLDAQEGEHDSIRKLMDQLDDKLNSVTQLLAAPTTENGSTIDP